jgi:hypothetical protein
VIPALIPCVKEAHVIKILTLSLFLLLALERTAAPGGFTGPQEPAFTLRQEIKAIAQIESGNGRNMEHARLENGIHAGTRAGGRFGLMPLTVQGLLKNSKFLRTKYGFLQEMDPDSITEFLTINAEADWVIATYFWNKLRERLSREQAAYAWFNGAGALDGLEMATVKSHPYVQNFKRALYAAHELEKVSKVPRVRGRSTQSARVQKLQGGRTRALAPRTRAITSTKAWPWRTVNLDVVASPLAARCALSTGGKGTPAEDSTPQPAAEPKKALITCRRRLLAALMI